MIRLGHNIASTLLLPLIRLWLARRTRRGKEDAARIGERFGHASHPRPGGTLLWLHAASVGEAQSVLALVRALAAAHPDAHFLLTTGTLTSAALIAQQNLPRTLHQFIPVDTYITVKRFLDHWRPDLVLWVESEFWPQLLWQTQARTIPMLLINARMSERSFHGWRRWPKTIARLLACFTAIYAGAEEDAARLRALGAAELHSDGNLKYDAHPLPENAELVAMLHTLSVTRRLWVAASTHANEEQMIAEVQQRVLQHFPEALCLLIPRHATRGDAIAEELRYRGIHLAQRSKGERITDTTQIYLADTMGELGSFYRAADLVFIGGSLVTVGGHNPLEPARLSNALITGPHIHNFAGIMQHLLKQDALCLVSSKTELAETVIALLRDEVRRGAMAARALSIVTQGGGATEKILQHVGRLLHKGAS